MHTEGPHLCQIITTFTTGLTALNGLTAQVQNFAVGTTGTDFNIASAVSTHTFNLPTASATNRGALSSADWTTFNSKQNALTLTTTGSSGAATLVGATLNIPNYGSALSGYLPLTGGTLTGPLNGTSASFTGSSNSGSGSVFPRLSVKNTLATQGDGSSTFNFADINISSGNDAVNMFLATTFAAGIWAPAAIINVATNHDLQLKTNNTTRLTISAGGNVGIGISSAGAKLQVRGANELSAFFDAQNEGAAGALF
jgi:hypothetical protein